MVVETKTLTDAGYAKLFTDLRKLWEAGKAKAHQAVNQQLLQTYWEMGRRLALEDLTPNAGYEKTLMDRLADDMKTDVTTLYRCIQFHETYKAVPGGDFLTWSHYRILLTVKDDKERGYYTGEAETNHWTRDQLLKAVQGDRYGEDQGGKKGKRLKRPFGATYVYKATVLDVVDGDTLVLDIDIGFDIKKKQRIRLAGIDAPEIDADGGQEAADYVRKQLSRVTSIMVKTSKVDINGRFLGWVFYSFDEAIDKDNVYAEGKFLNQELLDRGLARAY